MTSPIAIIGLGYVGLPLAVEFGKHRPVIGFDINEGRIAPVDPYHMFYSIWATTQHYADFRVQIDELSPHKEKNLFSDAESYLTLMYRRMLTPAAQPS